MKPENEIKESLKTWVTQVSKKPEAAQVNFETDLLTGRIISSLQIMDLIIEIERLRESPANLKKIKPGVFKSINTIYETFFKEVQ